MILEKTIEKVQMANSPAEPAQRNAALVAGLALITMGIAAGFAFGFVFQSLVVPGDAAATANNIQASENLFRIGIFGWLVILVCDVLVAWGLYVFLKQVNKSLSLLTAWFRLIYTAILGIALLNLVIVLLLTSGAEYLTAFNTDQMQALVMLFINAFNGMWTIGLVVFGLHLFGLGYLVFRSGFIPKILGVLLIFASFGYLITDGAYLLLPNYEAYEATLDLIFMIPMFIGELGLAFWLLYKTVKLHLQEQNGFKIA